MNTFETLKNYCDMGWKIFPIKQADKTPLTLHGLKDASNMLEQIEYWIATFPDCNWGLATGEIVVVDIDPRHGGTIEALPFPETLTVETGGGGLHLYYKNPGYEIRNSTDKLAQGIDVRGIGGYVVIPPSIHASGKEYKFLNNREMELLPDWLFRLLEDKPKNTSGFNVSFKEEESYPEMPFEEKVSFAIQCLGKLSLKRVDNYDGWVKVGMSLFELGETGLTLWDDWSSKSEKYTSGACADKWESFNREPKKVNLTLKSLGFWAKEDTPYEVRKAPRKADVEDYRKALLEMGYTFRLNEANNDIVVSGVRMDDILRNVLLYKLKLHGYSNDETAVVAWTYEASQHKFHPIVDYLQNQKWDGIDHISNLCSYFEDKQGVFPTWLRRWLIGAVAKVMAHPKGQQNRMLILDGKQELGKSFFVRWLARGVPGYHVEAPINPEDKDSWLRLMSKWIWEVSELGSTTRKADREALKNFLSSQDITVRKSYGHYDTEKPALANFIGTINNEVGFLNDPTGSRRFMSCTLTSIDWSYSKDIDVNQVWAQAVELFHQGETWNLTKEEKELSNSINVTYEIDNPLAQYLVRFFEIDPTQKEWKTPTSEIGDTLKERIGGYDIYRLQKEIGTCLSQMGLEKSKERVKGYDNPVSVWVGIKLKLDDIEENIKGIYAQN